MPGLDPIEQDTDAWATGANQATNALNDGFIPDQTLDNGTGVLATRATFATDVTFTVPGDATAFYVVGRRLKIVHAGGTTYCEVASAVFGAVTTVTIGTITSGPATMTTPITSVAVGPIFFGNAGNSRNFDDHSARHDAGGADALAIDAIAATGSLRTLGAGAQQAAAGNHSHATLIAGIVDASANAGETRYFSLGSTNDQANLQPDEVSREVIVPRAMTVTALYFRTETATPAGNQGWTLNLRKNGGDAGLSVAVAGGAAAGTHSVAGSIAYAAGDRWCLAIVNPDAADATGQVTSFALAVTAS